MEKEENKKSKKKVFVLILFLFAVIALAGYGVYSYYYTTGEFTVGSNTIQISTFDPETIINSNSNFLGNGGTVTLSCGDSADGSIAYTCTGSLVVRNNGDTPITIELDGEPTYSVTGNMSVYNGSISVGDGLTIEPDQQETIDIEVNINDVDGEGVEVYAPVDSSYETASATFKLKARQYN